MIYDWKCDACQCTCETVLRVMQVVDPQYTPTCPDCGLEMRRDWRREGVCLAESSRSKGIFPYVDTNLDSVPIEVQDQQHRRKLMKERGLVDNDVGADAKARARDMTRKPSVSVSKEVK
jgi:hypothetical protein